MGLESIMKLKIEKLGPIKDSEIELGDVTLFLGPPNTGKSYTLRAIYAKLFPLDTYVLTHIEKKISKRLVSYLEDSLPEHLSANLYELARTIVKIFVFSTLLYKEKSFEEIEKISIQAIEKAGFKGTVIWQGESLITRIVIPPINVEVSIDILKQVIQEILDEFTSELIPETSSVTLEPVELTSLDIDIIGKFPEKIDNLTVKRKIITIIEFYELLGYVVNYVLNELIKRYEKSRRISPITLMRYLRYTLRYSSIGAYGEADINTELERLNITSDITIEFRIRFSNISSNRPMLPEIRLEDIDVIVDSVFGQISTNPRIEKRIIGLLESIKSTIAMIITNFAAKSITRYTLRESRINNLGYHSVRFIPFGRIMLVLGLESASRDPVIRSEYLLDFMREFYPIVFESYVYWASRGRGRLLEGKLSENQDKLVNATVPLLEGKLEPDDAGGILYRDWRKSRVDIRMSSALVEEISGLLFALLSVNENAIVLVEEPEAQLHPSAQIVMALFLASLPKLCGCRIVASTHSDLLAITLSQLAVQKPNKKWIIELLYNLLPHIKEVEDMRIYIDTLAEAVAEAVEELDLRIYEFTREGLVKPSKPEDVLGKEVPGISKVIDELTNWSFRLASQRELEKQG